MYSYAPESNRLISVSGPDGVASYQYDASGNTVNNGEHTFTYDARNRFIEADRLYNYEHNALGQRVIKPRFRLAAPGDASGDGVIDENDLHVLRDILRGRMRATAGADCNQDGNVNNGDVSCIATQIGDSKRNGKANARNDGDRSAAGARSRGRSTATMSDAVTLAADDPGQIVGQILFVYDEAGHLIGEYDELGNVIREYVWFGNRPLAMLENDSLYYVHSDHLNTPQAVTDGNQSVVWRADYEPFGEVTETVSNIEMPLRYPGQVADEETGLYYNYFRTYDPSIGRYTQSDPIGLSGGPNTFAYVEANPILYMDRAGLFCIPLWSESSEWKNTGNLRNAGKTIVLPQSFGGFGTCSWKRLWLQEQERTVTPRELCYDCEEKCEGEECSWKIKRGTPRVETRDHERWEKGGKTNQVITGGPGREQGC